MSGPIAFYVNGVERSIADEGLEWDWTTNEVLGGVGNATFTVQDRTNTWEPEDHWTVLAIIRSSGWVLYRGEIISHKLTLPDKFPWRRWTLSCSDSNYQLPWRLVGALDGKTWMDQSGLGVYVNIDPFADTLETDKQTIQTWFDHYFRIHGDAVETDTYVNQYIDDLFPQFFNYSNMQSALEEMASRIAANLQFWIDPDLFFHWVTIPAWQDMAQELLTVATSPQTSTMAMMLPEGTQEVELAPADLGVTHGLSDLEFDFDGGEMPEQVYVKGATGYVYNAPPLGAVSETKTTVKAPSGGPDARYEITFLATTKLWHRDSTGYISTSFDTRGPGGPFSCRWVHVPWNEARHKGGYFWKVTSGPSAGKLVDNNTNTLNGYGQIRVQRVTTVPAEPKVGVGGSGWTNEVDQDPDKRQQYLDASISTTRAERDAVGGTALYRGQFPTLRGSCKVRGVDEWRVGQYVHIQDSRLPDTLNGRYFVIQGVEAKPVKGQDMREYKISFGDGPESRYTAERRGGDVEWPGPFIQIDIKARDLSPGPNSTQRIEGQLINGAGESWKLAGKTVNWSFECYNSAGVLQTNQGEIDPEVSITDKYGKAYTRLTTGPGTSLVYYVFATVKAV